MTVGVACQVKKYREINLTVRLADSAFPLFLHLKLAGASSRIECEEVRQQAIELSGIIYHGEVARAFKVHLMHVLRQGIRFFLRGQGQFEEAEILSGLKLTGYFLLHRVFSLGNSNLPEPRLRLEEKYSRCS